MVHKPYSPLSLRFTNNKKFYITILIIYLLLKFLPILNAQAPCPLPKEEKNSGKAFYIKKCKDNKKLIVFVHGIFGDPMATWRGYNESEHKYKFFHEMVAGDIENFKDYNVYTYGYESKKLKDNFSIFELGKGMESYFRGRDLGKYEEIIFVCHSLGGLVTRAFLVEAIKNRKDGSRALLKPDQVKVLYLYGTPCTGVDLVSAVDVVTSSKSLKQMDRKYADKFVDSLNTLWANSSVLSSIPVYCAYEKKPVSFLFYQKIVVTRESATAACYDTTHWDPLPGDHMSIVKPGGTNSESYVALLSAIRREANREPKQRKPLVVPATKPYRQLKQFQPKGRFLDRSRGIRPVSSSTNWYPRAETTSQTMLPIRPNEVSEIMLVIDSITLDPLRSNPSISDSAQLVVVVKEKGGDRLYSNWIGAKGKGFVSKTKISMNIYGPLHYYDCDSARIRTYLARGEGNVWNAAIQLSGYFQKGTQRLKTWQWRSIGYQQFSSPETTIEKEFISEKEFKLALASSDSIDTLKRQRADSAQIKELIELGKEAKILKPQVFALRRLLLEPQINDSVVLARYDAIYKRFTIFRAKARRNLIYDASDFSFTGLSMYELNDITQAMKHVTEYVAEIKKKKPIDKK